MSRLKAWWNHPDQFDWVTNFLRQHGLLRAAQLVMVVVVASSALAPITVVLQPQQFNANSVIVGSTGGAFCVFATWFWLIRWPTRRQSEATAIIAVICIAVWSLGQPSPATAALGSTAMVATGSYIAFFHSNRLLIFDFVLAVAVAVMAAIRLADQEAVAATVAAFWLICLLNIAVPLAIRGTTVAMSEFAVRSDEDPLTGLLNRRGFLDAVHSQLVGHPNVHTHLTVIMVDLDDFKTINDTYGHDAGDRVLTTAAELLRQHIPRPAAICRAGGEEFLIALTTTDNVAAIGTQVRTALAGLPHSVTASIGIAHCELSELGGQPPSRDIEHLLKSADLAMYAAKRRGGNQVQFA